MAAREPVIQLEIVPDRDLRLNDGIDSAVGGVRASGLKKSETTKSAGRRTTKDASGLVEFTYQFDRAQLNEKGFTQEDLSRAKPVGQTRRFRSRAREIPSSATDRPRSAVTVGLAVCHLREGGNSTDLLPDGGHQAISVSRRWHRDPDGRLHVAGSSGPGVQGERASGALGRRQDMAASGRSAPGSM
jgi:hypothetical protein